MNIKFGSKDQETLSGSSRHGLHGKGSLLRETDSARYVAPGRPKSHSMTVLSSDSSSMGGKSSTIFTNRPGKVPRSTLAVKALQPKRHNAKILVWTDLSVHSVDCLNEATSSDQIKQILADSFMLGHYNTNHRVGIVMDLYYNTLQFAMRQHFTPDKTSAFFSIIKSIFDMCIETPFENLDYTHEYFRDLLRCHSINCPPYSIVLFTPEDIMRISQYTTRTFFRHFEMYKYAFTPQIELDVKLNYVGMPPSQPASEELTDIIEKEEDVLSKLESRLETVESINLTMLGEELKNELNELLTNEGKKIEDKINQHFKTAADVLQSKLTQLIAQRPENVSVEKDRASENEREELSMKEKDSE